MAEFFAIFTTLILIAVLITILGRKAERQRDEMIEKLDKIYMEL